MAYIYQADTWCDTCGQKIVADLVANGAVPAGIDPDNPDTRLYDSDDFPKPYDAEQEESDRPEHCCKCCAFLRNPLTRYGYHYVMSVLNDIPDPESAKQQFGEWADFYSFSYFKQPYSHPLEWLEDHIASLGRKPGDNAELVQLARDLAGKLDGDTIQDMFQSEMDSDDYFKKSGWYSPEMY